MRFRRRQRIPKPAQAHCDLCGKLFCYFQITKSRVYCDRCLPIWRHQWNVLTNEHAKQQRRAA